MLDKVQEKALITWIELLNLAYTPPMAKDIEATANRILKHGGSNQHVSKMYSYQFIACLPPHINLCTQKPKEKARMEAEMHGPLIHWYEVYGQFLKDHQIQPNELYNWDKTGFQLG